MSTAFCNGVRVEEQAELRCLSIDILLEQLGCMAEAPPLGRLAQRLGIRAVKADVVGAGALPVRFRGDPGTSHSQPNWTAFVADLGEGPQWCLLWETEPWPPRDTENARLWSAEGLAFILRCEIARSQRSCAPLLRIPEPAWLDAPAWARALTGHHTERPWRCDGQGSVFAPLYHDDGIREWELAEYEYLQALIAALLLPTRFALQIAVGAGQQHRLPAGVLRRRLAGLAREPRVWSGDTSELLTDAEGGPLQSP